MDTAPFVDNLVQFFFFYLYILLFEHYENLIFFSDTILINATKSGSKSYHQRLHHISCNLKVLTAFLNFQYNIYAYLIISINYLTKEICKKFKKKN